MNTADGPETNEPASDDPTTTGPASAGGEPTGSRRLMIGTAIAAVIIVAVVIVAVVAGGGDDDEAALPADARGSVPATNTDDDAPGATTVASAPASTGDSTPDTADTDDETDGTDPAGDGDDSDNDDPDFDDGSGDAGATDSTIAPAGARPAPGPALTEDSLLVFRNTQLGETYGMVSVARALRPDDDRTTSDLSCDRLDMSNGRGVCARSVAGTETIHEAVVFDEQFVESYRVGLLGPPSRVRVSPSGSTAAVTSFVTGHEYESADFSTQTILVDLDDERVVGDLETDFVVERDGAPWSEEDFNFWGVTFADDDLFYATLGTGGSHYLVEGKTSAGVMRVIHENGQCPELSPDGTRLAYRMRVDADGGVTSWRLAVLDLDTARVTELAETRTVDDQPTWLGDDTITYGLPVPDSPAEQDTWAVPADGVGEPRMLLPSAWSAVLFTP